MPAIMERGNATPLLLEQERSHIITFAAIVNKVAGKMTNLACLDGISVKLSMGNLVVS